MAGSRVLALVWFEERIWEKVKQTNKKQVKCLLGEKRDVEKGWVD